MELFRLAQTENRALTWDECLAEKAHARARTMVNGRYFDHKAPGTGKNPAWGLVARCLNARFAGENLSRGEESAQVIHNAWMESPTHRKNLQNHKFSHLGVGCFQNICVQLFAGL